MPNQSSKGKEPLGSTSSTRDRITESNNQAQPLTSETSLQFAARHGVGNSGDSSETRSGQPR